MAEQQTDYRIKLDKLPSDQREQYVAGWRTYLQKLPREAFAGQLTRLTQQFGSQFASELIQPELDVRVSTAKPITDVPAADIEPEVPWFQKPLAWAVEQETLQPLFKGLRAVREGWIAPASLTAAQLYSPEIREQLRGRKGIGGFGVPKGERSEMWEEANIPWLAKTATELAVDPLSYFGWGLGTKGVQLAERAGFKGLAAAIKPIASAEEAYIRAAAVPIKAAGKALQKVPAIIPDITEIRAGRWMLRKPFEESPKSAVRTMTLQTANALHSLDMAGDVVGKPFSQVLQDLSMGIPDAALLDTLRSNPTQLRAIDYIVKNSKNLGLDEIIKVADIEPVTAGVILSHRVSKLLAAELGIQAPTLATGALGVAQRLSTKLYTTWKQTVLQTPWYVQQNLVENYIRQIFVGVSPSLDITDIMRTPGFKDWPMEIQSKVISLTDRWNKTIPETTTGAFARTPMMGGMTEASIGRVAIGKAMPASTVAAFLDDTAIVNTFRHWNNHYVKTLMETSSPETANVLARINGLYDNAIYDNADIYLVRGKTGGAERAAVKGTYYTDSISEAQQYGQELVYTKRPDNILKMSVEDAEKLMVSMTDDESRMYLTKLAKDAGADAVEIPFSSIGGKGKEYFFPNLPERTALTQRVRPTVEPQLLEHLKQVSLGSVDDIVAAFAEIQRNKTMTISRAMNELEKALPDVIKSKVKVEIPRLWAKNNIKGINRLFEDLKRTLPQRIETYQKQLMVQRIKSYRDLLRTSVPKQYQPYVTRMLNRFKYPRKSEAESALASATSVTKFERALFNAHVESRRELEILAEWTMITEAAAKNIPPETLGQWFVIADEINLKAFNAGDRLVQKTLETSKVIRFAKDPAKIQQAWDSYIMEIQSLAPDSADIMRQATPSTDMLWHTYRGTQEQRWFNVGQEKLRATGLDLSKTPRVTDASGKILTQEDFLQSQLKALESWEERIVTAWEKRHVTPTAKNKLLDTLREETIIAKESISLQELQIRTEASKLALDRTYSTFGNYAQRTNLDEFMQGVGVPFWFFPSRSIPFYITQMTQRPRLGMEILKLQNEANISEQPSRLFGTLNIPGTNYWYNPIGSTMLWQLSDQRNFMPAGIGGLERGQDWLRNTLGISLGPQWKIGTAMVERMMGRQTGETILTMEPSPIIPQQRWLDAVAGLKLPVISAAAGLLNEPFDMYLRAVYGDTVANWQQREVEKTIVDMGFNPQDAPEEVIQNAWKKYYIRQLLSIPGGAIKEMTPTEIARFEAINQKAKELDLTKEQRVSLRQMGESPFVGLRQDQMEAIYADVPAEKLWRYIRPWGLTNKSRPVWEDYIQFKLGRETLLYGADKDNPTKGSRLYKEQQYDKALNSGRISPREWKSLYRQNYADYISRVNQLERDFPLAPKTDADWEAYRELLGWDEPVRHPDDIALDKYYETMESSKFENELGEFDFDAYRKAEDVFFQTLSPDTLKYILSRKDKYKSPLRAAYTRDMETVQAYFNKQDEVLAQYPPEIKILIERALASPDPAIQRALLVSNPQAQMALRRIRLEKEILRRQNPEMDRILRFWNS